MLFLFFLTFVSCAFGAVLPSLDTRIVGGYPVDILDVPYQVGIVYYKNSLLSKKQELLCGGAIIRPNYVLTAAQCVYKQKTSNLRVSRGSKQWDNIKYYVGVKKITTHKKYSKKTLDNDIALIRVSQSMPLVDPAISLIAIPKQGFELDADIQALITGWGARYDGGPHVKTLYGTVISTVGFKKCVESYPKKVTAGMTCAAAMELEETGPCLGDVGAPMVIDGVLVGLYSWGSDCAVSNAPGVYTKVAEYSQWISANVQE